MKAKLLWSMLGAFLVLVATTAFAPAWPDQPPDKVLISGPGIEGQVEIKEPQALAIFRLGHLEDLNTVVATPPQDKAGYKIVRFFYGGTFDFARLTYHPDPGGRGYLYWEDGPALTGNHTPYDAQWMYVNASSESELRSLLQQVGAKVDDAAPVSPKGEANTSSSDANKPGSAGRSGQVSGAQTTKAGEPSTLSLTLVILLVGVVVALGAVGALALWRVRRNQAVR